MGISPNSPSPPLKWPFDLRVFAVMSGLWSVCLMLTVYVHQNDVGLVDPLQTVFAGVRFDGTDAQVLVMVEAGILMAMAVGVFAHQRWGLLLALVYMCEVVASHLLFVIAYLPFRLEWMSVRATALQGPMLVMITLYLWIRSHDLIFRAPADSVQAHPPRQAPAAANSPAPQMHPAVASDE